MWLILRKFGIWNSSGVIIWTYDIFMAAKNLPNKFSLYGELWTHNT